MGSEQQFCLRWNNHQSTLISVFDTLLESETLVDVTLAAEGQYLKAHKVVLSACSQYFQELLCHHTEKHPIIILKDVTFQELKALIDYMYRGEVNVSQEQLSALIKTAESLKIKGLADGGDRRPDRKSVPQLSPPLPPVLAPALSGNLSLDGRSMGASEYVTNSPLQHVAREGSISPVSRKRKRIRRRSGEGGGGGSHEPDVVGSEPSSASTISVPNIPATITPVNSGSRTTPGEGDEDESGSKGQEGGAEELPAAPSKQSKSEPGTSLQSHSQTPLLEPKSEYREEDEDDGEADEDSMDNVVALDEDVMDMEGSRDDGLDQKPGPSHGAEVSGQGSGFAPWHMMPERSGDDIFIPSQESAAQRESQESLWTQPSSTSPPSWKITSVESGNMSAWLEDADPREATSNTCQDRDMDLAIDSTLPPTAATLHISNNLFQEMPDNPQTSSNIVGCHSFRSKPKLPKSSGTSRVIQSDLYSEATGFKPRRGRPLGSLSKKAAGRSFIMPKKAIGEVPFSLNKPEYVYKKKLPLGQPRKDSSGSPLGLSPVPRRLQLNKEIGPGVVPSSKMKSDCVKKEKKRRGRPRKGNVKSTSVIKIKRPVGRPRKETIAAPPESGPGHIPILQRLLLNAETGLEVSSSSQVNSNSAIKCKGTLWRPPRASVGTFPKSDSDNTADSEIQKEDVVPGKVFLSPVPSISAENMKQSIRCPTKKTLRSPPGSVSGHSPVSPSMQLSSDLEPRKFFLLNTNSTCANKMKSPLGRPPRASVGLLPWSCPGNAPRSEMLKDEVVPEEVSFSSVKSLSANKIKRPVGRPSKETVKSTSDIKIKRPVGRPRKETVGLSPGSGCSPVPKRLQFANEVESGVVSFSQVKSISPCKVKRPAGRRRKDTQGLPSPSDSNHTFGRPTGLNDGPSVAEESDFQEEYERLKEILGLTLTAGTSKTPVPQRLQLNAEMEPRGVSSSKTKSISGNKIKRPIKRRRKKIDGPREISPRYVPVSQRRKLKAKVGKPIVSSAKVKFLPVKKIKRPARIPRNTPLGSTPGPDPENTPPTKRLQSNSEEGLGMISIVESSVGEKTERPVGSPLKKTVRLAASSDPDLTCDRPNLITEVVPSFKNDSNILDAFNKPVRGPEEIPAQPSESGCIHILDLESV